MVGHELLSHQTIFKIDMDDFLSESENIEFKPWVTMFHFDAFSKHSGHMSSISHKGM